MTRGNSLEFLSKMVGSDLTITTWDNVEKVEIYSLGKMFVIVVGVGWGGAVGSAVQCLLQYRSWGVSDGVS